MFLDKYSLFSFFLSASFALPHDPKLAPRGKSSSCDSSGQLDLSRWTLQLPTGSAGNPDQIGSSRLASCSGYTSKYFYFTENAITMKVPGSPSSVGCVTTPNSKHCRTELRESQPRSWDPKGSLNRMKVTLSVPVADDSKYGTVVGQIHVDDKVSSKPVCELFHNQNGVLTMGVSQIVNKSSLKMTEIGKVSKNETWSYEIRYEKSKLSVAINGEEFKVLGTGNYDSPPSYFKVGNYNQGDSKSEVLIYSIDIEHS